MTPWQPKRAEVLQLKCFTGVPMPALRPGSDPRVFGVAETPTSYAVVTRPPRLTVSAWLRSTPFVLTVPEGQAFRVPRRMLPLIDQSVRLALISYALLAEALQQLGPVPGIYTGCRLACCEARGC
jgi:hypothetical protein